MNAVKLAPREGPLARWHRELRSGTRTKYQADTLWRAACREAMAGDFDKLGLTTTAKELRREASEMIGLPAEPVQDRFEQAPLIRGRRL